MKPSRSSERANGAEGESPALDDEAIELLRRELAAWRAGPVEAASRKVPPRLSRFSTWSDLEVPDLVTPADVSLDYSSDLGFPGRVPVHPRRTAHDVPRSPVDDAHVRGVRHPRADQPPLQVPAVTGADRSLDRFRFSDLDGLRLRLAALPRRSRHVRRRGRHACATWKSCSTGFRSTRSPRR